MDLERAVASHYARPDLEAVILDALAAAGTPAELITPEVLAPIDEFHLGWRAATLRIAEAMALSPSHDVLDLGAGIGGPARTFAATVGCHVTGVDLTPEFVAAGNGLTRRCGLDDKVELVEGSILALPFTAGSFDRAVLIHVGMNIADKATLFSETRRVLRPDGRLAIYDIMSDQPNQLTFPLPWAETPETSTVDAAAGYRALLADAGFSIEVEEDWSAVVLGLVDQMAADAERHGANPLGLHTLVGPAIKERFANVVKALRAGILAPTLMIARPS